jgi:hypothetical protein
MFIAPIAFLIRRLIIISKELDLCNRDRFLALTESYCPRLYSIAMVEPQRSATGFCYQGNTLERSVPGQYWCR